MGGVSGGCILRERERESDMVGIEDAGIERLCGKGKRKREGETKAGRPEGSGRVREGRNSYDVSADLAACNVEVYDHILGIEMGLIDGGDGWRWGCDEMVGRDGDVAVRGVAGNISRGLLSTKSRGYELVTRLIA